MTTSARYHALQARACLLMADSSAALAEATGLDPYLDGVERAARVAMYRECEAGYRRTAANWARRAREAGAEAEDRAEDARRLVEAP